MKTVFDWLRTIRAGDIMTRDVAVLRPGDRLADAVSLFMRDEITGAPVVDDKGVCLGVISATDIVCFEEKRCAMSDSPARPCRRSFDSWEWSEHWWREFGRISHEIRPHLEESVAAHMTRDVVSVAEDAPLGVVIRSMVESHVHRVLVLDADRRLCGIITTMDVLDAALRAGRREMPVTV
jgi:CBS domain-containing protein